MLPTRKQKCLCTDAFKRVLSDRQSEAEVKKRSSVCASSTLLMAGKCTQTKECAFSPASKCFMQGHTLQALIVASDLQVKPEKTAVERPLPLNKGMKAALKFHQHGNKQAAKAVLRRPEREMFQKSFVPRITGTAQSMYFACYTSR